jgi:hypothetical protein
VAGSFKLTFAGLQTSDEPSQTQQQCQSKRDSANCCAIYTNPLVLCLDVFRQPFAEAFSTDPDARVVSNPEGNTAI